MCLTEKIENYVSRLVPANFIDRNGTVRNAKWASISDIASDLETSELTIQEAVESTNKLTICRAQDTGGLIIAELSEVAQ